MNSQIPPVPPVPPTPNPTPNPVPPTPTSGSEMPQPGPQSSSGILNFEYPGYWAAVDWGMSLSVNGQPVANFKFLSPYKVSLPLPVGKVTLKAKMSFRTSTLSLNVVPGQVYTVILTYNRFWGSIKLNLRKF